MSHSVKSEAVLLATGAPRGMRRAPLACCSTSQGANLTSCGAGGSWQHELPAGNAFLVLSNREATLHGAGSGASSRGSQPYAQPVYAQAAHAPEAAPGSAGGPVPLSTILYSVRAAGGRRRRRRLRHRADDGAELHLRARPALSPPASLSQSRHPAAPPRRENTPGSSAESAGACAR